MNILITGANTGIGRVTAEEVAAEGVHVWLACRSRDKTQPVVDAINARKKGLLPLLRKAGTARIVNVASKAHRGAKGIDWDALKKSTPSTTGVPEYGVSTRAAAQAKACTATRFIRASSRRTCGANSPGPFAR